MASRPRSPQSKKALSYAKDRRNSFGENDKAARKAVPMRKAGENRRDRRGTKQAVLGITGFGEADAAVVESSVRQDVARVGGWRKTPDVALGAFVKQQLDLRASRNGRKARHRAASGMPGTP